MPQLPRAIYSSEVSAGSRNPGELNSQHLTPGREGRRSGRTLNRCRSDKDTDPKRRMKSNHNG